MRDYARRAPARYLATQKAANPHDPADAELAAVSAETVEVAAGVLRGYPIPEGRHVDAIRALRSAVHGFVLLEVQGGFGLPESVDDSFETLIAMAAGGLADPALWVLQEVGDGPRNVRAHITAE